MKPAAGWSRREMYEKAVSIQRPQPELFINYQITGSTAPQRYILSYHMKLWVTDIRCHVTLDVMLLASYFFTNQHSVFTYLYFISNQSMNQTGCPKNTIFILRSSGIQSAQIKPRGHAEPSIKCHWYSSRSGTNYFNMWWTNPGYWTGPAMTRTRFWLLKYFRNGVNYRKNYHM